MEVQKSMIKDYKKTFLLFLFLSFPLFSVKLSEVRGILKLSNYNELNKGERKDGLVYIKGEKKPFTGTLIIYREDRVNIEGIYFYKNGKTEGEGYDYYKNGQLYRRFFFNNDIRTKLIGYYENGVKSNESNLLKDY